MAEQRWLPLESNPEVMTKYCRNLGVPQPFEFVDIYGFDPELLAMVPRPVLAVLLLFPSDEKAKSDLIGTLDASTNLYYTKQTIGNACGTIGIVHAILNNADTIPIDGYFKGLLERTKSMNPDERAKSLEEDTELTSRHEESAQEGQTQAPDRDDSVKFHFVTFVHSNGGLYELDGVKGNPVRHCDSSPDKFLEDAGNVIKQFIERAAGEHNFSAVALVKQS